MRHFPHFDRPARDFSSRSRSLSCMIAGTALVLGMSASQVFAQQEPNPNVSVSERFNPDFSPKGIPAGAFRFFPSLAVGGTYDSNIFATENDEESDFITNIRPTLRLNSEFARHRLNFVVGSDLAFHADNSENDHQDYFARANGVLEIRRNSILSANIGVSRNHQDRSDPDEQDLNNDITKFNRLDLGLAFRQGFNRVFALVGLTHSELDFVAERDDDRDRGITTPFLRLGYDLNQNVDVFVEGRGRFVRYDETPDDGGFDRNSDGYAVVVGADLDFTGVLFGEVEAGFTSTEVDDNNLNDTSGFGAEGSLTYNVTDLTSIIGSVDAGVRETTVVVGNDVASSNLQFGAGVRVEHELRRNVLLNGTLAYVRDDFEGTERTDDTIRAGGGVRYSINRNLALDANYGYTTRSSDIDTAEFDRHRVFVGANVRF